jgi:hypothetical protein
MAAVRRKCFISYHHADQELVNQFVRDFDHTHDAFIARGLGEEMPGDIIQSTDTDYVMRRIREDFLHDTTVTIVLAGRCTWARRYVDWEILSSLRTGQYAHPNGLLGIRLPGFTSFPSRFEANLSANWPAVDCYARHMDYPSTVADLYGAIEAAYVRRTTHAHLIKNPRERMFNNSPCS